jgi:DNA-binding IscR family transcriptional regulator
MSATTVDCRRICYYKSYMKSDSRLSGVLHILLHMAEHKVPMTSERLAEVMETNPVVVRRIMAGVRDMGLVRSERGHGGGWTLSCDLAATSSRDIYVALGEPVIVALGHRNDNAACLVEQAVNAALGKAFSDAEARLLERLGEVTLADLAVDFHHRMARRGARKRNVHAPA